MARPSDNELRAIDRTPKSELVAEVERWAQAEGHRWVIGGPRGWSKDELVAEVLRIRYGKDWRSPASWPDPIGGAS